MQERRKRNVGLVNDRRRTSHSYFETPTDDSTGVLNALAAIETAAVISEAFDTPSMPDPTSSSDFGGFDGGSSGGGGADGSW